MTRVVRVGDCALGGEERLALIAGPCAVESEAHCLEMAGRLREIAAEYGVGYIFKASYDKAQRSSVRSYRGPGVERGLEILERVKRVVGVPVLSDVHCVRQIPLAARVLDVLRIPAFLSRQTDIIVAAGRTGKPVEIKKGQFMAPEEMANAVDKVLSTGNQNIIVTERGTTFGYRELVVDMRALAVMRGLGFPVVFDASHPCQVVAGVGAASGGRREFVPILARAAVAVGVDGLFLEVHDRPDQALCDGPISIDLEAVRRLLEQVVPIDRVARGGLRAPAGKSGRGGARLAAGGGCP